MAGKKENKTTLPSALVEGARVAAELAVSEGPEPSRKEARLRVLCALVTSPRFSVKIEREGVQDLLVEVTDSILRKLGY